MLRTSRMARRPAILGLLGILAAFALSLWGCGSYPTSYTDPNASITTTQTPTALIDAATLKQWTDEGKVNSTDPRARDRVVIVEVTTTALYGTSHIPNSAILNSSTELTQSRLEAVAALTSEPPDGPSMDALIQRLGIDGNTTVVFSVSAGQNFLNATRAYFTFRYWGFPKARLKVLQGGDDGWTTAGYTLTAAVPGVRASSYSVRSNFNGSYASFSMRAPIGEMIDLVDKINAGTLSVTSATGVSILDTRGGVDPVVGPYLMNAGVDDWTQYYVTGKTSTFKPTADMVTRLGTFGVTATKTMNYVYCASGHRSSSTFFILDGILNWPVRMYDGSSGQWLAYRSANNVGSNWRVDTTSPNTTISRTAGTGALTGTLTLDPLSNAIYSSVTDPRANQIANTDRAYVSSGGGGGGTTGGGGGTGSPSGC